LFLLELREFPIMNAEYACAFGDHRPARIDRIVCVP
jgi:hypothetical protein